MAFSFEQLKVYQSALALVSRIEDLILSWKGKISHSTLDQLSRAALSVSLNIAEGNGRWAKSDRRQFFLIARGSVFECVPIIQLLRAKRVLAEDSYADLYYKLEEITKMLTGLINLNDVDPQKR